MVWSPVYGCFTLMNLFRFCCCKDQFGCENLICKSELIRQVMTGSYWLTCDKLNALDIEPRVREGGPSAIFSQYGRRTLNKLEFAVFFRKVAVRLRALPLFLDAGFCFPNNKRFHSCHSTTIYEGSKLSRTHFLFLLFTVSKYIQTFDHFSYLLLTSFAHIKH